MRSSFIFLLVRLDKQYPTQATTQAPIQPPNEGADEENNVKGEFENNGLRLTATQSCDVNQLSRLVGDSKIVNGVTAGKGKWPWIVSMSFFRFEFGGAALCGGSIINDQWMVSAAHCCRDSIRGKLCIF